MKYEKLPNCCYSCGIIGHSSVECPTLAEHDENSLLPYGKDLHALDDNKQKKGTDDRQSNSAGRTFNFGGQRDSSEGRQGQHGTDSRGNTEGSTTREDHDKSSHENESLSPVTQQTRKNKMNMMENESKEVGKELFPSNTRGQSTKHKQIRTSRAHPVNGDQGVMVDSSKDAMALITTGPSVQPTFVRDRRDTEIELEEADEINKKMQRVNETCADRSAEAALQPRWGP